MPNTSAISINLYKLDMVRVSQVLPTDTSIDDVPQKIIERYNASKGSDLDETSHRRYNAITSANLAEFAITNNLAFYQKDRASTVSHSWSKFFEKKEISLGNL